MLSFLLNSRLDTQTTSLHTQRAPRAAGRQDLCVKDCALIDSHALGSPHFRKEGLLIGILDVLKIGRGDLHLMWLNKQKYRCEG